PRRNLAPPPIPARRRGSELALRIAPRRTGACPLGAGLPAPNAVATSPIEAALFDGTHVPVQTPPPACVSEKPLLPSLKRTDTPPLVRGVPHVSATATRRLTGIVPVTVNPGSGEMNVASKSWDPQPTGPGTTKAAPNERTLPSENESRRVPRRTPGVSPATLACTPMFVRSPASVPDAGEKATQLPASSVLTVET